MHGEGFVDLEEVVGVDDTIEIQVAVGVAGQAVGKAGVETGEVVGIDEAVQVGVADVSVFEEDGIDVHALAVEGGKERRACAVVIEDRGEAGDSARVIGGSGAGDARAGPARRARKGAR